MGAGAEGLWQALILIRIAMYTKAAAGPKLHTSDRRSD